MKENDLSWKMLIISYVLLILIYAMKYCYTADTPAGIPIILDASCTYWVNQYGDKVSLETADAYFSSHYEAAEIITYLNICPDYTPTLYSSERQQFLENKQEEWKKEWEKKWKHLDDDDEYRRQRLQEYFMIYKTTMEYSCPSTKSLDLLSKHLYDCRSDTIMIINGIYSDCLSDEEIKDHKRFYYEDYVWAIYLTGLANFGTDGTLTELCNNIPTNDFVPLILNGDGSWYNKDGIVIDIDTAHEFFFNNKDVGLQILQLNQNCNPYYLQPADQLNKMNIEHELSVSYELLGEDNQKSDYSYCRLLNAALVNANTKTLQEIYGYFRCRDRNSDCHHMAIISNRVAKANQSEQIKSFGYYKDSNSYTEELFIIALSNLNKVSQFDYVKTTIVLQTETIVRWATINARKARYDITHNEMIQRCIDSIDNVTMTLTPTDQTNETTEEDNNCIAPGSTTPIIELNKIWH
jgi:hypothetical protein